MILENMTLENMTLEKAGASRRQPSSAYSISGEVFPSR